jgi:hypothetical protein
MKHRSDTPNGTSPKTAELIGSFRTFGEYGVLYEVVGIEADAPQMAQIVVVETGEKVRYPVQQLMGDPVVH